MICFPKCKDKPWFEYCRKTCRRISNIETVFYPINWYDALETIENKGFQRGDEKIKLSLSGLK